VRDEEISYRPSTRDVRLARTVLGPWRALTSPRYFGMERIPDSGAVLLVGNHTIFGLLDAPLMAEEILRVRGRFVRGLAERAHYTVPGWRDFLERGGAVLGTRENCRELLAAGEAVLVYPGGGREVAKRKGEKYRLIWKERLGFARLAIETGCAVVPFGAVGAEETYDILLDADHPMFAPVRRAVEAVGGRWELAWPVARGIGPTPLPRPERFYFSFGEPIDATRWAGRATDHDAAAELRDLTRDAIDAEVARLLELRERDPRRRLRSRLRPADDPAND
jgi:1-acyl-sn-glycerol-3-phosphate acyltransferase